MNRYNYLRHKQKTTHDKFCRYVIEKGWVYTEDGKVNFEREGFLGISINILEIDLFWEIVFYWQDRKGNFLQLDELVKATHITNGVDLSILTAYRHSIPRLYEIKRIDAEASALTLWDVGEKTGEYIITDKLLSQTAVAGELVVLRLLDLDDVFMASGIAIPLRGNIKNIMSQMQKKERALGEFFGGATARILAFNQLESFKVQNMQEIPGRLA